MRLYEPPTKEFFRLPNNIFDLGLTPIQFSLYAYLVSCAGSSTICWPSLKTICAKTGIGLTAVQDHLKVLEKRQIIQIGKRKTKNGKRNSRPFAMLWYRRRCSCSFPRKNSPCQTLSRPVWTLLTIARMCTRKR